jgi:capsular exopolysaccharide synthesis family protein
MAVSSSEQAGDRVDLRDAMVPLWRRKWVIVAITVVGTVGAYLYSNSRPAVYTASTTVYVRSSPVDTGLSSFDEPDQRTTQNQARLLTTRQVAIAVARRIHYSGSPDDLLGSVTATPSETSDFVDIEAKRPSGQQAADVANGFAESFIELRSSDIRNRAQIGLRAARQELSKLSAAERRSAEAADIRDRVRTLEVLVSLPSGSAEQVDEAQIPKFPTSPRPKRTALLGFALSLVLAGLVAFILERFDHRVRTEDEISEVLGVPGLGVLPHVQEKDLSHGGRLATLPQQFREPLRFLRSNLQLVSLEHRLCVMAVTSAVPSEGKSTVALSFARTCAESGLKVALVDADLRRGTLASRLGVRETPGLTDILTGAVTLEDALQAVPVHATGFDAFLGTAGGSSNGESHQTVDLNVLAGGLRPPDPSAVLAAEATHVLLHELSESHDLVIVDTPPILTVSDALAMLPALDGLLFVARLGQTSYDMLRRARNVIASNPHAKLLGVVVNDRPEDRRRDPYGQYEYHATAAVSRTVSGL